MTSGQFSSISIDSIVINREERQRRVIDDIEELADSLHRLGLINPIVLTREHILVAGERRLTAAKSLGWDAITFQYADQLDPIELKILEYEENAKRKALTWQEEVDAVAGFHNLRRELDPTHTQTDTAAALGLDPGEVSRRLAVANEVTRNPELLKVDRLSTAVNIAKRETSRRAADAVSAPLGIASLDEPEVKRTPLINTDFIEWSYAYTGPRFNFIHCDFPYGVGMHRSDQGAGQEFGTYADGEDVYWALLDALALAMENVVADSAHLMFWFSMDYYERTRVLLGEMGWKVNPFPLVWFKSDNTGIIPDAQRGPRRVYETALFASRGDRLLTAAGARANVVAVGGRDKAIHMNEKPVAMLQHFMSMFVDDNSRVLDPTAGSGNALKAARNLGATQLLGIERDKDFFDRAVAAYDAHD